MTAKLGSAVLREIGTLFEVGRSETCPTGN